MFIGKARHPARLIAVRATPEVARELRRVQRAEARQRGKQPNKDMLTRDGWHIITTNVVAERMRTASLLRKNFSSIPLNIEKIAHHLGSFIQTLVCLHRFADFHPDPRHLQMDKRSRESLQEITLACLS